jgi:hypothetical protein
MSRDDQVKAGYAALGEFLQEFGHAVFELQSLIVSILQRREALDEDAAWAIAADRAMTAGHLIARARGLVKDLHGGQTERIFADIADRFDNLIANRNDLLHGLTFVGWGNRETTDWSEFDAFKIAAIKNKLLPIRDLPQSAEGYQPWIAEAKEIAVLVRRYMVCVLRPFPVEKNFAHQDGHWRAGRSSPN